MIDRFSSVMEKNGLFFVRKTPTRNGVGVGIKTDSSFCRLCFV